LETSISWKEKQAPSLLRDVAFCCETAWNVREGNPLIRLLIFVERVAAALVFSRFRAIGSEDRADLFSRFYVIFVALG
jgi:hypothetical protein